MIVMMKSCYMRHLALEEKNLKKCKTNAGACPLIERFIYPWFRERAQYAGVRSY